MALSETEELELLELEEAEYQDSLKTNQPKTLAGKTLGLIRRGLPGPLRMKEDIEAVASGSPERIFEELMPAVEKGTENIGEAINRTANIVTDKFPRLRQPLKDVNLPVVGMSAGRLDPIKALTSTIIPPRPSGMVMAAGGALEARLRVPSFKNLNPLKRIEGGIESNLKNLGQEGLTPEIAGQSARDIYRQRVGVPLEELTMPPREVVPLKPPRSGQEIFRPEFESVSGKVHPTEVTSQKVGETAIVAHKNKVKTLLKKEKDEWNKLSTDHFEKPLNFENTKSFISEIFKREEETSALDRLNPTLKDAALKTPNPERTAQSLLKVGQGTKDPTQIASNIPEGATTPEVQGAQLQTGYGALTKLFNISQEPSTFGRAKTLRSQLGGMIDWNVRGDQLNHYLKGAYRSLTEDMKLSSRTGGFEKDVDSAIGASKEFFRYQDLPSSNIIGKAKYPSDLPNRLIKTDSPERVTELYKEHNLSKEDKAVIQRGILDRLNKESGEDPRKFVKMLSKYSKETKKAIFEEKTDLVNSLEKTVKVLDDEITRSKLKPIVGKTYKAEDVLSRNGSELNKIMRDSNSSELVEKLVKDGSPEMARVTSGSVGKEGMKILRRSAINSLISGTETKTNVGSQLKIKQIAQKTENWSP